MKECTSISEFSSNLIQTVKSLKLPLRSFALNLLYRVETKKGMQVVFQWYEPNIRIQDTFLDSADFSEVIENMTSFFTINNIDLQEFSEIDLILFLPNKQFDILTKGNKNVENESILRHTIQIEEYCVFSIQFVKFFG